MRALDWRGWLSWALGLAIPMSMAGCGAARGGATVEAGEKTVLEVDNRALADMTIYVIDGGQRVRLGIAAGNGRTELTIPARMVGRARELSFLADPIGSRRTAVSDTIFVEPGDRVTLMIPAQ